MAKTHHIERIPSLNLDPNKGHYDYEFDKHMNRLLGADLVNAPTTAASVRRQSQYDQDRYRGLLQIAFENSSFVEHSEAKAPNWEQIEKSVSKFESRISELLGNERNIPEVQPMKDFTIAAARYFLIYADRYPDSISNPWAPQLRIIQNQGLLFTVSDDRDYLRSMIKGRPKESIDKYPKNLGIIVKGRVSGSSGFNGFVVDDRYSAQTHVFHYLKQQAYGIKNRKTQGEISKYLTENQIRFSTLQESILTPLKKTGLIGSSSKGFFYIQDRDDLLASCQFHMGKIRSMERIVRKYRTRETEFNIDLEKECVESKEPMN